MCKLFHTTKLFYLQIRNELEQQMNCNLKEYKGFIDNEMLIILGQMDKASLIFDHLYLVRFFLGYCTHLFNCWEGSPVWKHAFMECILDFSLTEQWITLVSTTSPLILINYSYPKQCHTYCSKQIALVLINVVGT